MALQNSRGTGFQEKATPHQGATGKHLAGETGEGWRAPSLRNLWTVPATVQMLETGQNLFGSVSGTLVEVIHHSTRYFSDADVTASLMMDRHASGWRSAAAAQNAELGPGAGAAAPALVARAAGGAR